MAADAPIGGLDSLQHGPGFLCIGGSVAVPPGRDWPVLTLELDGLTHRIAHAFAFPGGGEARAFREDIPWPGDAPGFQVTLCADGLPLATADGARWAAFTPMGAIEWFSQAQLSGWAYDPAQWLGGPDLALHADGAKVCDIPLNATRTDLLFGARFRGERLGFFLPAAVLGPMLDGIQPFGDGLVRRWSLVARGQEIAAREEVLPARARGGLDVWEGGALRGWAELEPERPPAVILALDGREFPPLRADGGRFALPLPHSPTGRPTLAVSARIAGEAGALPGSPVTLRHLPLAPGFGAGAFRALSRGRPRVAVVIPIHNAAEALRNCLASVIAHSAAPARLILVDDASTDPAVAEILGKLQGRAGIEILRNDRNLGFTASCNRGIAAAGRDDVILLNSDTEVPARWIENLMAAAWSTPETASATPFSDRAGAFSTPPVPEGMSTTELSRLCAQSSLATPPEAPTGHGFCLYLRRDAIDRAGLLDAESFPRGYGEENEWSMRALRAGLRHVVDDRSFVRHREAASFGAEREALLRAGREAVDARFPEYPALVHAFLADPQMAAARWRMGGAFARPAPRPRILFVLALEAGGTPLTNLDLMRALEDRYEPFLLGSDGTVLTLKRLESGALREVEQVALNRPIRLAEHASAEYDRAFAGLLTRHAIELVHLRHFAWHGLGLPMVARALGIPVVASLHDFYMLCASLKLLDATGEPCPGCCTDAPGQCRAELWPEAEVPHLRGAWARRWREQTGAALAAADALVTTAPHVRARHVETFPGLAQADFRVIPHGRDFPRLSAARTASLAGRPLRVLLPGHLDTAKGLGWIRAMALLDEGRTVEFHVLGTAQGTFSMPGLTIHGPYPRDEFSARARDIAPDIGAVLSRWPETHSHTLTELWAAGLPVLGIDLGAVGERLRAQGGGWLVPPESSPQAVLDRLRAIARDPAGLSRRRIQLRAWQQGEGAARDTAAMAADYDRLYRELRARRLAFARPAPVEVWLRLDLRESPRAEGCANDADSAVIYRPVPESRLAAALAGDVAGVAILCDSLASPALARVLPRLRDRRCTLHPQARAGEIDPAPGWEVRAPATPA
ncbi:glycosyltransferase [Roseococcus sp. SYP-B2431]|uniref:glycosyltransferase n=1 Tax=Roseococcus sp. SYP-B2431 TaxID=2496640 RepID=UPI00103866E1|nr:glycosyltransferase [Roseococcus sp. SYP-B2431]TCH96748.1 glycosyltransferase [Roseococcus sp. SYP-B2431]